MRSDHNQRDSGRFTVARGSLALAPTAERKVETKESRRDSGLNHVVPHSPRTASTRMRRFLAYLLCMTLLAQGVAYGATVQAACDSRPDCTSMSHTVEHGSADCCNDAETFDETGQPCKSGQACGHLLVFMPAGGAAIRISGQATPPTPGRATSMLIGDIADVWRPPSRC